MAAGPAAAALACALAGMIVGGVAILRGERALAVIASVLVGALVTVFVLGELLIPH